MGLKVLFSGDFSSCSLELFRCQSEISKPVSCSLAKSWIYHSIPLIIIELDMQKHNVWTGSRYLYDPLYIICTLPNNTCSSSNCKISKASYCRFIYKRQTVLIHLRAYIIEEQHDRNWRTANRSCLTNMTGLLLDWLVAIIHSSNMRTFFVLFFFFRILFE